MFETRAFRIVFSNNRNPLTLYKIFLNNVLIFFLRATNNFLKNFEFKNWYFFKKIFSIRSSDKVFNRTGNTDSCTSELSTTGCSGKPLELLSNEGWVLNHNILSLYEQSAELFTMSGVYHCKIVSNLDNALGVVKSDRDCNNLIKISIFQ